MNSIDLNSDLEPLVFLKPANYTASTNGTGVDVRGKIGVIKVTQNTGARSGTSPTWDGKFQDSPDNSTWTDVPGAAYTQVTGADNNQSMAIDLRSVGRYLRYVGTIGGSSSPNFDLSVNAVALSNVN